MTPSAWRPSATTSGVPPARAIRAARWRQAAGNGAAPRYHPLLDSVGGPLTICRTSASRPPLDPAAGRNHRQPLAIRRACSCRAPVQLPVARLIVLLDNGTLLTTGESIKARYVDSSGNKVGDLVSEDITLQQCCTQVPEPMSLMLLGSGSAGLGLWGRKKFKSLKA